MNVKGLQPATTLISTGYSGAYGPHCAVRTVADGTALFKAQTLGTALASVTLGSRPTVRLDLIDGDNVGAVNAFLRPYGRVKLYWRTGQYRFLPVAGAPSSTTVRPKASTVTPVAAPVAAPAAPVAPVQVTPAPVAVIHPATTPAIETVRTWRDMFSKQPVAKVLTKTFSIVGDVMVPSKEVRILDAMKKSRDAGKPAFALLTGPAGTAKTRLATMWGFSHDLPVIVVDGMSIQTATDWFGMLTPVAGGEFEWVWSDAAKLIQTGQPCLIIIDELNRPENERALNGVMPLLDWKGTAKPLGAPSALRLMPGQCIVATLNEGIEYVGTVEVDAAVRDRFGRGVRMEYLPKTIEARVLRQQVPGLDKEVAKRLVQVASSQRAKRDDDTLYPSHNVISARVLVDVASDIVVGGLEPKEALWGSLKARFTAEDEPALTVLIDSQFGPDAEDLADLADDEELEQMMSEYDA